MIEADGALRLVLGFSPGSMSDQIARAIAPALSRELQRPVEVVLRPGENGATAAVAVAGAVADGDTLFVATMSTHALAPHFVSDLPYRPLDDFTPVSLVGRSPLVLACHPTLHVTNTAELIRLARERPGMLAYGTSSFGGAPHLAAELFANLAGVELRYARYDHTERLYDDLEAGRIELSFNNIMSMLPRCRRGALRALAVTTRERSPAAPELPTVAEGGLGEYDVANWLGVVAPKATPRARVDELSRAVLAALQTDEVARVFGTAGVTASGSTSDEFADFIARDTARWKPIVARIKEHA